MSTRTMCYPQPGQDKFQPRYYPHPPNPHIVWYQLPSSGLFISSSPFSSQPCTRIDGSEKGHIPVKAVSISHPEERYSASGVPRDEVSMLEASRVTEVGTSLLCPLASISINEDITQKWEYVRGKKEGHTAKNQILIPSLANSQT
jgi:hypothetical protein